MFVTFSISLIVLKNIVNVFILMMHKMCENVKIKISKFLYAVFEKQMKPRFSEAHKPGLVIKLLNWFFKTRWENHNKLCFFIRNNDLAD